MKRLKFKNPFNGFGNALKLIPENYRVEGKEFEMTDGKETYRIKWENNKGRVLSASDGKLVKEDINRLKQLMGYKSSDTLGLLEGKDRVKENQLLRECTPGLNNRSMFSGEGIKEDTSIYGSPVRTMADLTDTYYRYKGKIKGQETIGIVELLSKGPSVSKFNFVSIEKGDESLVGKEFEQNYMNLTGNSEKEIHLFKINKKPADDFDYGELERDSRAIQYGINPADLG